MYGAVPPEEKTVAVPLASPKHKRSMVVRLSIVGPVRSFTMTGIVKKQPFASLTNGLYTPAKRFIAHDPTVVAGSSHCITNGATPPITFTQALPLLNPQVEALIVDASPSCWGWVITTEAV